MFKHRLAKGTSVGRPGRARTAPLMCDYSCELLPFEGERDFIAPPLDALTLLTGQPFSQKPPQTWQHYSSAPDCIPDFRWLLSLPLSVPHQTNRDYLNL
ncbi:unnamed protein product, partial [Protopolystoma xenopodis]